MVRKGRGGRKEEAEHRASLGGVILYNTVWDTEAVSVEMHRTCGTQSPLL